MGRQAEPTRTPRERILVCGVRFRERIDPRVRNRAGAPNPAAQPAEDLEEAFALVAAADADVVGEGFLQRRDRPVAATLMGRGKVDEIAEEAQRMKPDAVVVDNDLSPAQVRNLEKAWCCRVIDRSELILDIFASRARTRQARLQVELAQNEYLLPRLRRMWTHLERMEGAVGTRGPGETQLETDRRLLHKRVHELRTELSEIEARKQREVRSRTDHFRIGLVGYTNAGKSTLLNKLTGSEELVADMLFATLDTRTRRWRLSDGRTVLLSDTVGFIRNLPHHLVASFHATLEETLHADLLMHVVDASHPDAAAQMAAVDEVLGELGSGRIPGLLVFNKVDCVEEPIRLQFLTSDRKEPTVFLSARTGEGLDRLEGAVRNELDLCSAVIDVILPAAEGKLASDVRRMGGVLEEEHLEEGSVTRLRARLTEGALGHLRHLAGGRVQFVEVEPARSAAPRAEREDGRPDWLPEPDRTAS
jgi:GTP-binding protein HflX